LKKLKLPVLTLLLLIFGSTIYYFEIYKKNIEAAKNQQAALVVKIPKEEIVKIAFFNSYDEFEITKAADAWFLQKPVKDQADRFVTDRILEFFSRQAVIQDLSKEQNAEEKFGFSDKNIWIQVTGKSQDTVKVSVSDLVGLQGSTYLRVQSATETKYYLAASEWRGEFDRTLLYFRDKFIFREDMNSVSSLEKWQNGKKLYEVKDLGEEKWQWIAGSQKVNIDKNQVYEIIKDLVQASATDFLDVGELSKDKKKLIGFDKKLPSFVFHLNDNKKVSFSYSIPNTQKTYIELDDKVYELFSNALVFLDWQLDDFKNRSKPFQVKIDESSDITYISPTREVKIVKQDSVWSEGFPGNRFLRILGQLKVVRYLPEVLPPQVNSSIIINFSNSDNMRLSWSNSDLGKEEIFMTSSRINETFLIGAKELNDLISFFEGVNAWDSKDSESKSNRQPE
jgi:hypothetical protein